MADTSTYTPEPERFPWSRALDAHTRWKRSETAVAQDAIAAASRRLAPLCDPLKIAALNHPSLGWQTEQEYSTHLAWCLQQVTSNAAIVDLLGIPVSTSRTLPERPPLIVCDPPCTVLLDWSPQCLVSVDVKLESAEAVAGNLAMEPVHSRRVHSLLLATRTDSPVCGGFEVRLWGDLCHRLRRHLPEILAQRGVACASLVATFVGVVERNILAVDLSDPAAVLGYLAPILAQPGASHES